jgi:hypothetical protein
MCLLEGADRCPFAFSLPPIFLCDSYVFAENTNRLLKRFSQMSLYRFFSVIPAKPEGLGWEKTGIASAIQNALSPEKVISVSID